MLSLSRWMIGVCSLSTAISGCVFDKKVAQVGSFAITEKMVVQREAVAKTFYPKEPSAVGLLQLVRFYRYAEIMKSYGKPVTEEQVQAEAKRIDQETRDPSTLKKIKDIFGSDEEAYHQVFVLPNYVDRVFYYQFFLQSPEIQNEAKERGEQLLAAVQKDPRSFSKLVRQFGWEPSRVTLDPENGIQWIPLEKAEKDPNNPEGSGMIDASSKTLTQANIEARLKEEADEQKKTEARQWVEAGLSQLKEGQVYSSLIPYGEGWCIVKFMNSQRIRNRHTLYHFEGVAVPKVDFSKWVEKEEKEIPVVYTNSNY